MRRAASLLGLALVACAVEPSYEGRLCDETRTCPNGYECGTDGTCHVQGGLQSDGGPKGDAAAGLDASADASSKDSGATDAAQDTGRDAGTPDAAPVDAGPPVVSLRITPSSVSLAAGFTAQLAAEATFSDQSTADVSGAVAWTIVDPSVATIDAAGLLQTLVPGTTIVNAALGGVTGSAALNVSDPIVVEVETWNKHNLVVKSDGTVWGWGWNQHREIDPIAEDQITAPVKLAISDVAWARAGGTFSIAVKRDGTVWAWGGNGSGQLGLGRVGPAAVATPTRLSLSNVRDIRCGYDFALALMTDGTVRSWGANSFGSLGLGGATNTVTATPTAIPNLAGVTAIAAGTYHGAAIIGGGAVAAWGYNAYGQLGHGVIGTDLNTPGAVVGIGGAGQLGNVAAIDAGWGHTMALTSDGRALAWGWNAYGQLGDLGTTDRIAPAAVSIAGGAALTGITRIAAGFAHSLALGADGRLMSWGNNLFGQLGAGTTDPSRSYAAPVLSAPGGLPFAGSAGFAGGGDHAIVRTDSDEVWAFGSNVNAELGNGTFGMGMFVLTPVPIVGL